jgi:hypothetical protein
MDRFEFDDCGGFPESFTPTLNPNFPTFAGLPEMVPVEASKLSPGGNSPEGRLQE